MTPAAIALSLLRPGQCHWPIGDVEDPAFAWCGHRVAGPGMPYCQAHAEASRQTRAEAQENHNLWTAAQAERAGRQRGETDVAATGARPWS